MPFDLDAFRRDVLSDPLVYNVWTNKYKFKDEPGITDSQRRVVDAIMADETPEMRTKAHYMVSNGYFLPAGRINAGAGTDRNVTLLNCYVGDTIQDSMPGIQLAIAKSAFTLQQGGGIGNDFSTVRPAGALVKRTGSVSSGAIAFMHQMSTMSDTVCSAGERRGAMMTTLADWHADLWNENQFDTMSTYTGEQVLQQPSFISVKRQKGKLTQTNISVLVSDMFMKAVADGDMWDLGFWCPRADGNHIAVYDRPFPYDYVELNNDFVAEDGVGPCKGDLVPFYVYRRVPARRIWNDLMESTYKYAEPGVIFIDRINVRNNLYYCEDIRCTNPCGEQPLPPFGTCCLGSINVAFMVEQPFTDQAHVNMTLFHDAVYLAVRFLDNVLDKANYPLPEQRAESMAKRRIGLGITGVADALIQMGQTYGSEAAVATMEQLAFALKINSYNASIELAVERGPFPLYDRDKFVASWNVLGLPFTQNTIEKQGIRNGVLNTVAPNGTISIYSGNTAQGIEPVFTFEPMTRKVRQPDGSLADYTSMNYSHRLWNTLHPDLELPDYFVSAMGGISRPITPEAHIRMQAACQKHIDASISKTVNCPPLMTFDEFKDVYWMAYEMDCKGCTTYRPDPDSGRGSVLSVDDVRIDEADAVKLMQEGLAGRIKSHIDKEVKPIEEEIVTVHPPMFDEARKEFAEAVKYFEELGRGLTVGDPDLDAYFAKMEALRTPEVKPPQRVVEARRYKLKWPQDGSNWYVTITRHDGAPFEVFITTSGADNAEWVQALSRLLTAILRRGGDVKFLINELCEVHSARGGGFIAEQHKYRPSVIAAIGGIMEEEFKALGIIDPPGHTDMMVSPESIGDLEVTVTRSTNFDDIAPVSKVVPVTVTFASGPDSCPECHATPLVHEQGCRRCLHCPWSDCG